MSGLLVSMEGAVSQGIVWGIMVLGVYITYKVLNIADLTVDGSFALGSVVCALLIAKYEMNPLLAMLISGCAGMLAGAATGFLHTVCEIPAILAGILTQLGLWSVNLRILDGASNMPILKKETLFTSWVENTGMNQATVVMILGLIVAVVVIILLYWFFGTEVGAALRATGNNEDMVRALGVNTKGTKMLGLMISNGLVGLSGGLVAQMNKYGDINSGVGAIVVGLAAIVIGEVLMGKLISFGSKLTSAIVGSVLYFVIRAVVLRMGMKANDMKLFSAVFVAIALSVPVLIQKWRLKRSYVEGEK